MADPPDPRPGQERHAWCAHCRAVTAQRWQAARAWMCGVCLRWVPPPEPQLLDWERD